MPEAASSSTARTISGNSARRVVVADDHVACLLMPSDESQLTAYGIVGVLGVEEREVDPREPELLEHDRDVAAEKHDVILDELGHGSSSSSRVRGPRRPRCCSSRSAARRAGCRRLGSSRPAPHFGAHAPCRSR